MEQLLKQIADEYYIVFYIRQVITILVLFIYGYLICNLLLFAENINADRVNETGDKGDVFNDANKINTGFGIVHNILLAFPMGISVFGVLGLFILISGIKYEQLSVLLSMVLFLIVIAVFCYIKAKKNGITCKDVCNNLYYGLRTKKVFFVTVIIIVIALFAVSGIVSVGFSNDSMYYYSEYPRAIVNRGYLYYGFDVNLTDAGQTTVVINTLPYLLGFDETFGIHTFFNINFIVFFAYAIYEQAKKRFDIKKSVIFSALFTLLLLTSMPFVIISKWNIANVYFMEQMFICLYLYFKANEDLVDITYMLAVLMMMLSFMRIEGSLYAILVILCALTLNHVKRKAVLLPAAAVLLLQSAYFYKIYYSMELLSSYTFLTKEKAIIIIGLYVAIIIYGFLFADRDKKGYNDMILYVSVLILANIGVFLYDKQSYTENVRALVSNVLQNSGWGFFPAVIVAFIILVPKVRIKTVYFDLFCICFILMSIIACCLRGGILRVSFADSGNRVFLQIVPFVVYAFAYRYIISFNTKE